MNKYLEKIATVPHLIKARRRVIQMLSQGTHDFKQMSFDSARSALNSKVIHKGSWGTNGPGVYAGHKAPAHEYQPHGSIEPTIAFPSDAKHAIPHENNHRFHYNKMPVQDSVIPHDVHLNHNSYITIPGSTNKPKHIGEKLIQQDLEPHIRSSKVRRIYGEHLREELTKRNLTHSGWDSNKSLHTGNEYLRHIHDKLRDNIHNIPNKDLRHTVKTMGGVGGIMRDNIHKNPMREKRMYGGSSGVRQSLRDIALGHMAETGAYRKYKLD